MTDTLERTQGNATSGLDAVSQNRQEVAALVGAAAGGQGWAWNALVDRFSGLLWSVIRQYRLSEADAADVRQIAWMRLAEHIGGLREPEWVGAWLARTARRECLAVLRRTAREVPIDEVAMMGVPGLEVAGQPGAALEIAERHAELREAFVALRPSSQDLLLKLFADELTYEEISASTGIRIGSIGPTRGRCLAQLRHQLESRRTA